MRRAILVASAAVIILALLLILVPVASASACTDCKTPGYWKNHPDAWPVGSLCIGGETYTKQEILGDNMLQQIPGDKWSTLFRAVVAAKLNVANGCYASCQVRNCICAASWWLGHYDDRPVAASSEAWQCGGERLYWCLDAYNNS